MQPVIIESKPNPRAVAPIVAEVFPGIPEPDILQATADHLSGDVTQTFYLWQ